MDVPKTVSEVIPEKIEDKKDEGRSFHCNLSDSEIVHKIAQQFLPGLASACVDNTMGGIFRTPGSVAVDIRTEMIDYLTKRSETFVAESVILETPEAEVSDHPYDIISDFVDDFASTKRNLFSRVSGWLLSDKREDKIDDFVQEMEISGFWLIDRREAIAHTLLKNVDFKNEFHCNMKFNSAKELNEHIVNCGFRSMICANEGCNARFSASHLEKHDSVCPFKIIPCEQKCPDRLMRRDMDRHCITVCPMKLANCPFYAVGCQSTVPQCMVQQHRWDDLHSHLLYILQKIHKDTSTKDLKKRVEQLKKSYFDKLAEAPDVRSLTFAIKDLEAKLGPLEVSTVNKDSEGEKVDEERNINGGKVNQEVENNEEGKVDEKGQVKGGESNEHGQSDEEGKVDAKRKITREVKINEEGYVDEETKTNDGGKANGEGKTNEAGEVNKEEKVSEEGKATEDWEMTDQRKTNEAAKVNEGGKTNEAAKVNKEEKVSEEGKATEEGKMNDKGKINEAGKDTKEEKVSEEEANEEGKMNDQRNTNEAGKISEIKISEEEEINGGKM